MGKRSRRGTAPKKGTRRGWPHPGLVVALALVAVCILAQHYSADLWPHVTKDAPTSGSLEGKLPSSGSAGVLTGSRLERASSLYRSWQRGGPVQRDDLDWMAELALGQPIDRDVKSDVLLQVRAAYTAAGIGARAYDDTPLLSSLALSLANFLHHVSDPHARAGIFSDIHRLWQVPYSDRMVTAGVESLEVAMDAGKTWDDGNLVYLTTHLISKSLLWPAKELEQPISLFEDCIDWMNAHGHSNVSCVHSLILHLQYADQLDRSMELYRDQYLTNLGDYRRVRDGRHCHPVLHLLSLDTVTPAQRRAAPNVIVHESASLLDQSIERLRPLSCSGQSWPYFLHSATIPLPAGNMSPTGKHHSYGGEEWVVSEWKAHRFDEIRCVTRAEKKPILLEMTDVYIHGSDRVISSADGCSVYHVGFPFSSPAAAPTELTLSLPVVELEEVQMLSILQPNFFHMLIDETQQLVLAPQFDAWPMSPVNTLLGVHPLVSVVMPFTDVTVDNLVAYEPQSFVYHAKRLFLFDWEFADGVEDGARHTEDYFMPAQDELRLLRQRLMQDVALKEAEARTVLFVNRNATVSRARALLNFDVVWNRLSEVVTQHGALLELHDASLPLSNQIQQFNRADIVIGPHGAGLANILFCRPGTSVLELPIFPNKPSVYSMISAALQLEKWALPGAESYFFEGHELALTELERLAATVDHLLSRE